MPEPLTVADLIDLLTDHNPETPVQLATQPAWPFAYALAPVAAASGGVLYLATADQLAYLPDPARDALAEAGAPTWT